LVKGRDLHEVRPGGCDQVDGFHVTFLVFIGKRLNLRVREKAAHALLCTMTFPQKQQEGVGTGRAGNGVAGAGIFRQDGLYFAYLRPHDVLAVVQNRKYSAFDLRPYPPLLFCQIDKLRRIRPFCAHLGVAHFLCLYP
jgi:hypothetical protein